VPATERVLDHILEELDARRLAPGARVNAARIASQLQLSAAPVREALCVLAGRGVVDLLPDRGAVMRPITSREVRLMWELIAPVGSVGLRLAAEAIRDGGDPREIIQAHREIQRRAEQAGPLRFILGLNEWHFACNRLGGNEFVTLALERLGIAYWDRYLIGLIDVQANVAQYLENYRRMHEAVLAGDGKSGAAALEFHAQWSVDLIRRTEATLKHTRRESRRGG
jgi:DNA-binding GntR family transcriptional regulator